MIARDNPLLSAAVSRVVSAFTAVLREAERQGCDADLPAFQRLLDDPKLGLTPDEKNAVRTGDQRLVAEIWAEVTRRRGEGCFPYTLRPRRKTLH